MKQTPTKSKGFQNAFKSAQPLPGSIQSPFQTKMQTQLTAEVPNVTPSNIVTESVSPVRNNTAVVVIGILVITTTVLFVMYRWRKRQDEKEIAEASNKRN